MTSSTTDLSSRWLELNDPDVDLQSIEQFLSPITDDLWVTAACVDRLVERVEVQQSLLDLGLKRTEQALKRASSFLEHYLVSDEEDGLTEEQRTITALTSYFQEEAADARLCHLRTVLLKRLDRLNTYVDICKQSQTNTGGKADGIDESWEDDPWADVVDEPEEQASTVQSTKFKVCLPSFLANDLLDIACELAATGSFTALHVLLERHAYHLWPYRFAILEHIPDHVAPSNYRELLPGVDLATEAERKPEYKSRRTDSEWTERTAVSEALAKFAPDAEHSTTAPSKYSRKDPCSAQELAQWYRDQTERIINATGMVDHALSLVQYVASQGVPDLDELGEDLLLFSRLVYDAAPRNGVWSIDWTLSSWKALDPPAAIRMYLANSSPETSAKDITRLVMPYLFILEARAERLNQPDPALPQRLLYDYILQAPLEIVASIFEASKPTLPPVQRIVRNDEDMARLALACLYGSESLDEWPTMSKIFECLPAWDIPADDDEVDEADTTVASLSTFVTPSTTRPRCTPSDLILFFKPLPSSSLSRALDILDVHLESGEILARWGAPAPLRWFLQSNGNISEQRAWANRMARRAGGNDGKLESPEDWEWLLEDMLKLCGSGDTSLKGAFCLLSRDDVTRIFLSGLLASGQFHIAKTMLRKSCLPITNGVVEDICLSASQEFYDNASSGNYHFGEMKLAYDCLDVPQPSERIRREKDFIEATSRLCAYNLTSSPGVLISPIEVRLTKDRLSLVSRVLASNTDAYKHTQVILELVHKLGFVNDVVAEIKTFAMLADAALNAEDFVRAYETGEKMVGKVLSLKASRSAGDAEVEKAIDVCWVSCFQLGRHPEFNDTENKLTLLGRAIELCPPERLPDVLAAWRREESSDLDSRRERLATHGKKNGHVHNGTTQPKKRALTASSLTERLNHLRMSASPLAAAPDAAALANKAFHSVAANFPFSVASRGRSLFSDDRERSRSGSRPSQDGVEAQATRVLQKGLGWLLGEDD